MHLKLHHVNYSTRDVGAVAEFYRSLFNMKPGPGYQDARITSQGYDGKVEFLTDGTTEFHISPRDLGVAFRTGQSLNPVDRGHIAFRTDDIEAFKAMLREKNIQFADYGVWAMGGWYQIFLQDPDGTIVEVDQTDYKPPPPTGGRGGARPAEPTQAAAGPRGLGVAPLRRARHAATSPPPGRPAACR